MNYRKLPFDRVIHNLRMGRYNGKVQSADYANTGVQLFDERKFAGQLGRSYWDLRKMGLIKITEQSGWNLPTKPSVELLESFRSQLA